jgi:hypothetical protein
MNDKKNAAAKKKLFLNTFLGLLLHPLGMLFYSALRSKNSASDFFFKGLPRAPTGWFLEANPCGERSSPL